MTNRRSPHARTFAFHFPKLSTGGANISQLLSTGFPQIRFVFADGRAALRETIIDARPVFVHFAFSGDVAERGRVNTEAGYNATGEKTAVEENHTRAPMPMRVQSL